MKKELVKARARWRDARGERVHLGGRHWLEALDGGDVLLDVRELWHPDDHRRDGKTQGVTQQ